MNAPLVANEMGENDKENIQIELGQLPSDDVDHEAELPRDTSELVPPFCAGAREFNLLVFTCCTLLVCIPIALLICSLVMEISTFGIIAGVLFAVGIVFLCYSLNPVIEGALRPLPAPNLHSCFKHQQQGDKQSGNISVKRLYLIYNPHGGGGLAKDIVTNDVLPVFEKRGIEATVIKTTHSGHPVELASTLSTSGYDVMCIVGGDGSLHELTSGMLRRPEQERIPLGFIPAGSGNSIMLDLGCWDPVEAATRIAVGETAWIDALHVQDESKKVDTYSINGIFWGLVGDVAVSSERPWLRNFFKAKRYDVVAVWSVLKGQTWTAKVTIDGHELHEREFTTVFINNTQHLGKALRSTPNAYVDDGVMDVTYLTAGTYGKGNLLKIFNQLPNGSHNSNEKISKRQAVHVNLEPCGADPKLCNIDGEVVTFEGHLSITCVPKALQIMSPPKPEPISPKR